MYRCNLSSIFVNIIYCHPGLINYLFISDLHSKDQTNLNVSMYYYIHFSENSIYVWLKLH